MSTILIIEDETKIADILRSYLESEGFAVEATTSGLKGLELARAMPFDAAVVDVMMPGMDGLAVLDELKKLDDDIAVVMVTAYASVDTAVDAMKRGALDYITKPFKNDEVLVVLRNALERRQLVSENRALRQNLQARANRFG